MWPFTFPKAWVVSSDMGYGHLRAARALRHLAFRREIVTANSYRGIPERDRKIWEENELLYNIVSRFKRVPVLGDLVFAAFDKFQEIGDFYPKDQGLEPPTIQLNSIYQLMEKKQWGKDLIDRLNKRPIPLVCTFFVPAFMAEYWDYRGPIFLVVTDTDVSRAWAPLQPHKTRIRYLAPTQEARDRLVRYGIPEENVFLCGFPLPEELTGGASYRFAKKDLKRRIVALDPANIFRSRYAETVKTHLGAIPPRSSKASPVTLTFAVGGAGAQVEIGDAVIKSAAKLVKTGALRLRLLAGIHRSIAEEFRRTAAKAGLHPYSRREFTVESANTKDEYFNEFNAILRETDVLWTKPSELVFYAGLGVPIIIAPPVGSQEVHNKQWLTAVGGGIEQLQPRYTHEWLLDWIRQGRLAQAAMQGFIEIEKGSVAHIARLIKTAPIR